MDFVAAPSNTTEINSKKNSINASNKIINFNTKTCWVISDGKAGAENQSIGLANALNVKFTLKRIALREPWIQLAPWFLRAGLKYAFSKKSASLSAPWPDFIIASGSRSSVAALYIKSQNPKTIIIQLQSPGISSRFFDLLITPEHDKIEKHIFGNNVVRTKCALHRVTPELLEQESRKFSHLITNKTKKCVAILIGGNSRVSKLTPKLTKILCESILRLQKDENATILVTASRRTGKKNIALLVHYLQNKTDIVFVNPLSNNVENPYYGFLALADVIIVTSDSISMISEASSTGKPIYLYQLPKKPSKFDIFYEILNAHKITRNFSGKLESWHYQPIDDMTNVLERVHALLNEQQ